MYGIDCLGRNFIREETGEDADSTYYHVVCIGVSNVFFAYVCVVRVFSSAIINKTSICFVQPTAFGAGYYHSKATTGRTSLLVGSCIIRGTRQHPDGEKKSGWLYGETRTIIIICYVIGLFEHNEENADIHIHYYISLSIYLSKTC